MTEQMNLRDATLAELVHLVLEEIDAFYELVEANIQQGLDPMEGIELDENGIVQYFTEFLLLMFAIFFQ